MRIVCAPNAFKGSMTAAAVAAAMAAGARRAGAETDEIPVADGGDGTLDVLVAAHPGAWTETVVVPGPLGDPVPARMGWLDSRTAVIEMAEAAGLRLVPRPDALAASTSGVGELILSALHDGAARILLGVGGSATTDAGIGILAALGAEFEDGDGNAVQPASGALAWIARMNLEPAIRRLTGVSLEIAVDVDAPLAGPTGAAQRFAPQKGASPEQVRHLESGLLRFADLAERNSQRTGLSLAPGAGAAGGAGFGLSLIGARLLPGAALVCTEVGLDSHLQGASLALTGEGRVDAQTRAGKAPYEVALRARRAHVDTIALAAVVEDPLPDVFARAIALADSEGGRPVTHEDIAAAAEACVRDLHGAKRRGIP